eukprot:CAMPEP_0184866676 /NCGR_PEP_ID=MMETSP0580-20130426/23202_1 /TAXON_ID=1118495 /ORGANISM="Dactyliosolen fragilissimus" /LENGTH=42 /DNA_ID= /DNA_START= /DNA_END= /DNA_ORIENTATION=
MSVAIGAIDDVDECTGGTDVTRGFEAGLVGEKDFGGSGVDSV